MIIGYFRLFSVITVKCPAGIDSCIKIIYYSSQNYKAPQITFHANFQLKRR